MKIIMSLESGTLKRNRALLGGREETGASDLQLNENIQQAAETANLEIQEGQRRNTDMAFMYIVRLRKDIT